MWNTPIGQTVVCADLSVIRNRIQPGRVYLCTVGDREVYGSDYSFGAEFFELRENIGKMLKHMREHRRVLLQLGFRKREIDVLLCQITEYRAEYGMKH